MTDKTQPVEPVTVTVIGTGDGGLSHDTIATTPGQQPNLIVTVIGPIRAIAIRFVNTYLTILAGLVLAGLSDSTVIPHADFFALVMKCAGLSVAGAGVGLLKDFVTVFGKLEEKFPLLSGSV